jgi:hypothetical protein
MAKRINEETRTRTEQQERLLQLIDQRGAMPFDFDSLKNSRRWPEDENVDEFISAFHEWRREGKERKIL